MDYRRIASPIFVVLLASVLSVTAIKANNQETDTEALARIKSQTQKAPLIEYPKKDIRGRHIPAFDYLIVYPDCTSCSTFRTSSLAFMDGSPDKVFLVLTPDTIGIDHLLTKNRYFVAKFEKSSTFAELLPGVYAR